MTKKYCLKVEMNNQFVMDFLRMREKLHTKQEPIKKGTPSSIPQGITLATIIEEKPPVKEIVEYFKKRVEALQDD